MAEGFFCNIFTVFSFLRDFRLFLRLLTLFFVGSKTFYIFCGFLSFDSKFSWFVMYFRTFLLVRAVFKLVYTMVLIFVFARCFSLD